MTIIKRRTEDTLIKIGVICIYMLLSINLTYAQIKNITGIIIDEESREPLTGASVTVKGSRQGCFQIWMESLPSNKPSADSKCWLFLT